MYNDASQNITIAAGETNYNISFIPIAIYISFSAITNITVYHVDGINTTANNNSIYRYRDWETRSILKYDDDCPYCQRHASNVIIMAKELLQKADEMFNEEEKK